MKFSEVPVRTWVKTFKMSIIFTIFYVGVNGVVLLISGFKYPANPVFTFLTSWFNLSEDYSKLYDSFYIGFANNFLVPLVIITVYECIDRISFLKHESYFLSAEYSFTLGILATYCLSAYNWIVNKSPGNGSSILAFCFFIALIFYMLIEVIFIVRKKFDDGYTPSNKILQIHLCIRVVLIPTLSLLAYCIFVHNNPNWPLHLAGLWVFIILAGIFVIIRTISNLIKQRKMNARQE